MITGYINIPVLGSSSWKSPVGTFSALPVLNNTVGDAIITQDTSVVYVWNGSTWINASGTLGAMPTGAQTSVTVVTSATTTFVTALTCTVTLTTTASISAIATMDVKATTAACVMQSKIVINGVSGQLQSQSLLNVTDHYTTSVEMLSASLGPGTYTITCQINRLSGTGTVNFFQGSLAAIGLQGSTSNGITQLTGDVTTGPGSGSQVATIAAGVVNNAKIAAAAAIAFSKLAALPSTNILVGNASNVATAVAISGDATLSNAGALTVAPLAITNAKIANATLNLTTKVTGILPTANGGTGASAWTTGSIPFLSSGTTFAQNNNKLFWDNTNQRFYIGTNTGSGTLNVIMPTGGPTSLGLNVYSQLANHAIQVQNQAAMALEMINANAGGGGQFTGCLIRGTISRGTLIARTQAKNGDQVLRMSGLGYYNASNTGGETNYINYVLTEDYTIAAQGGEMNFGTTPNGTTAAIQRLKITNSGEVVLTDSHFKSTQAIVPTILPNTNAGVGASASLFNATDVAGRLELITGASALASGAQVAVTFNKSYNLPPVVVVSPGNSNAGLNASGFYVSSTANNFTINFATASAPALTYDWNYNIIETQ